MTSYAQLDVSCWACGQPSRHMRLTSASSFGPPDLDLRPAEMMRGTMSEWVQSCPHCHYVAGTLDHPPAGPEAVRHAMTTVRWRDLTTGWTGPRLVAVFLRHAEIATASGSPRDAGEALIRAAWAADDAGDDALGSTCRRAAAEALRPLLSDPSLSADDRRTLGVRTVDMLRRAGEMQQAAAMCGALSQAGGEGVIGKVLGFQADLIRRADRACHTVPSAG